CWNIGDTSAYRGAGSGHIVGAYTMELGAGGVSVVTGTSARTSLTSAPPAIGPSGPAQAAIAPPNATDSSSATQYEVRPVIAGTVPRTARASEAGRALAVARARR